MGGRPDLILGNYSDGNLVAALIGMRLGVTHATIAHALENQFGLADRVVRLSDGHVVSVERNATKLTVGELQW